MIALYCSRTERVVVDAVAGEGEGELGIRVLVPL